MKGKLRGRRLWTLRAALATLGLAGAVYAADQVTAPTEADMKGTIAAQKVAEGSAATRSPVDEHQREAFSAEQMLELAPRFHSEMKSALDRVENLRIVAYRSRDLIRMTCIDDKLAQMVVVIKLAEPRVKALAPVQHDILLMRERFSIVQQGRERVNELGAQAEECLGDNLAAIGPSNYNQHSSPTDNVFDPTKPPSPSRDVDRPSEASPFR